MPLKTAIAPYVITDFNFNNESLELVTNFEYSFVINEINTIKLINFEDTLIPIVHVRDNIEGFFNRSNFNLFIGSIFEIFGSLDLSFGFSMYLILLNVFKFLHTNLKNLYSFSVKFVRIFFILR